MVIEPKEKGELKMHLKDGIRSLREQPADIAQAEHNFFELADHLGISALELTEFRCFRCGNTYELQYASQDDKGLCKYCEEFDDNNGELQEIS